MTAASGWDFGELNNPRPIATSELYQRLNPQQKKIVEHPAKGLLVVRAGAGCGKTTGAIIPRAETLFNTSPGTIAVLTFGHDIREEMEVKANKYLPPAVSSAMKFYTSHALARRLIVSNSRFFGAANFDVITFGKDVRDLMTAALQESRYADKKPQDYHEDFQGWYNPEWDIAWAITDLAQARDVAVENVLSAFTSSKARAFIKRYQNEPQIFEDFASWSRRARLSRGKMMFRDMLSMAVQLPDSAFRALRFRHLLIDEAQDLSSTQHSLVGRLSPYAESLTIVGDGAQCIFRFAGSRPDIFSSVEQRYDRPAEVLDLTINYRSTKEILAVANRVLAHRALNAPIRLVAASDQEGHPTVVMNPNLPEAMVGGVLGLAMERGFTLSQVAFLARTNAALLPVEMQLRAQGFPVNPRGDTATSHAAFKALLAPFQLAFLDPEADPDQEELHAQAWTTLIKSQRFIGEAVANETWKPDLNQLTKQPPPARLKGSPRQLFTELQGFLTNIKILLDRGDVVATIAALLNWFRPRWSQTFAADPQTLDAYFDICNATSTLLTRASLDDIRNLVRMGRLEPDPAGIVLSTIHKAKGLEWDMVVLLDVGAGLPSTRAESDPEEEASIFYVGVTRARQQLVLSLGLPKRPEDGEAEPPYDILDVCENGLAIVRKGMLPVCQTCPHQLNCLHNHPMEV